MNVQDLCIPTKEEGPIGKERLYYLDLDSKHVSSLKLEEESRSMYISLI